MNVLNMFDLSGKVAVVTGAATGLGYQIAEALAEANATVVCADINDIENRRAAERLQSMGVRAQAIKCDVTSEADVMTLFSKTVELYGTVDIAFANAGIADRNPTPVHLSSTDEWNEVVAINLQGVYFTCKEALKIMVKQHAGKIITVASMWGLAGSSSVFPIPAYNATKGAVINLTREMALEYAPYNIQVNALCPGFFRTQLANNAYDNPDFVQAISAFTPMGRVAEAHEIKGTALYLASSASSYTTGLPLVSDGGCMAK